MIQSELNMLFRTRIQSVICGEEQEMMEMLTGIYEHFELPLTLYTFLDKIYVILFIISISIGGYNDESFQLRHECRVAFCGYFKSVFKHLEEA